MFANSAFGRISLILFSLACAAEDFRRQSVPRFFFGTIFVAELLFYLQLFAGGARALSSEIPASLLLSLPLLGFSLLTRESLGLGDAFFLLAFGLGAETRFGGIVSTNTSDFDTYANHSTDYTKITVATRKA